MPLLIGPGRSLIFSPPIVVAAGGTAAFDQKSEKAWSSVGTTPQTWTHTPVGTPTGVIIGIVNFRTSDPTDPTAVSYGGTSLGTSAVRQTIYAGSGTITLFGLASPASGAQTASVTLNGASGNFGFAFAMTVTGSDAATIFRTTSTATATSTSVSNTVASSAANDLVVDIVACNTAARVLSSPGAGQTGTIFAGRTEAGYSYKTAAGASEPTTWSVNISDQWWSNAVSVKHA